MGYYYFSGDLSKYYSVVKKAKPPNFSRSIWQSLATFLFSSSIVNSIDGPRLFKCSRIFSSVGRPYLPNNEWVVPTYRCHSFGRFWLFLIACSSSHINIFLSDSHYYYLQLLGGSSHTCIVDIRLSILDNFKLCLEM